jgi:hypothetical protein
MFRDPQLIITFQLALIGIVLIGGLFLIWKAVTRIEEKVDMLFTGNLKPEQPFSFELDDDVRGGDREYNNDIMMQQLFGNLEEDKQEEDKQEEDIQEEDIKEIKEYDESIEDIQEIREDDESIEEIEEIKEPNSVEEIEEIEEIDEINVEDNSTLVLSRNKLRQMRLEQVQRLCIDRNIDSDGTKNQLIEKLLQ